MLGYIFSKFFKDNKGLIKNQLKKIEYSTFNNFIFSPIAVIPDPQQLPMNLSRDEQNLIFIDSHLTKREAKEIYKGSINS